MLNIYIQEIHISTVPLHGRDIFIYHLGLDKILKKLGKNNPTKNSSQLLESPAPVLQQVAVFLLGAGEKKP